MRGDSPLSFPPPEQVLPGDTSSPGGARLGAWSDPRPVRKRWRGWMSALVVLAVVVALVIVAGSAIRLPYYSVSPGSALDLTPRVTVNGAPDYEPDGSFLLLFIRQRARVNVWEWLRATFDPDVDLYREEDYVGDQSPEDVRVQSDADMAASQIAAKRVALEAAGYEVQVGEGQVVLAVAPSRPAAGIIERGDVILRADGRELPELGSLGAIIRERAPGESVELTVLRDGEEMTFNVPTEADENGRPIIGVRTSLRFDFPVDIDIDTSAIGGPSAGLAMTLSIIDRLTPGDLTGGKRIAVTGTINEDGSVGEIGGISQKAVAARAAHADLMLVPKCSDSEFKAECEAELERAVKRAGSLRVVPVATVDEALDALVAAGGDPVELQPHAAA